MTIPFLISDAAELASDMLGLSGIRAAYAPAPERLADAIARARESIAWAEGLLARGDHMPGEEARWRACIARNRAELERLTQRSAAA